MSEPFLLKNFDWDSDVTDGQRDILFDRIASVVHKWRMEVPFLLWLETTAPLAHLASQGAIVLSPFLAPIFSGGIEEMQIAVKLLSESRNVRALIDRIEECAIHGACK